MEDITLRYSHISHVGNGFQLAATPACPSPILVGGCDSGGGGRWSIHDILVDDIQGAAFGGTGNMAQVSSSFTVNSPLHDVVLDHITFVSNPINKFIMTFGTNPKNPQPKMGAFTYTNSIVSVGAASIWSVGGPSVCAVSWNPVVTFNNCFTSWAATNNVIVGWPPLGKPPKGAPAWPPGNFTPPDYSTVFVQPAPYGGDYHTVPPYVGIGADIDTLNAYLAAVE